MLAIAFVLMYFRTFQTKTKEWEETLAVVKDYIDRDSSATNDILSMLDDHCTKCLSYHARLDNVISTDRFTELLSRLKDMTEDVNSFVHEGKDSREVTQSVINGLVNKIDTLTFEIISTLRLGMGLGHGSQDKKP